MEKTSMAELKDVADQFVKDLTQMNIAGLMMAFTPDGMMKAMAMQAQMAANGGPQPATSSETTMLGQEGDDHVVDITLNSAAGAVVIGTRWRDVAGAWKCNDIAVKA